MESDIFKNVVIDKKKQANVVMDCFLELCLPIVSANCDNDLVVLYPK